ncbi:hypothetical protein LCGC14_0351570 [marine sediment metagenome]|uniref:Uncharacterized protein n=1 Tax=marine sediment metagenome TaxID=412755 RepID=A0A0F9WIQ6_9ZZZZ
MKEQLREKFRQRLITRFPVALTKIMSDLSIKGFMIAGGFLIKDSRDIDIFFDTKADYVKAEKLVTSDDNIQVLSKTKNAVTFRVEGNTVQFCSYVKESLKKLVKSFDYAHCQIGAWCSAENFADPDIYFTDDFIQAMTFQSTYYTGSDYPLSSLIRMFKYKERGLFSGASYIMECIKVFNSVVERGFSDYDDFKDQLDAVDLGLLPDELKEMENDRNCLRELFDLLNEEVK